MSDSIDDPERTRVSPPPIGEEFGRLLVSAFNDQASMPVHLLFNSWWSHAPENVSSAYVEAFAQDAGSRLDAPGAQIADPVDLSVAGAMAPGTLGRAYHDWIVDNSLQASIATDYRALHQMLVGAGILDRMPADMQSAMLRGFQVHDFQHVITGYDASGVGEIALQAFCLGQTRFPYFGMWMSVITAQMTFVDPSMMIPMMDAVSGGWTHGRAAENLAFEPWESMLEEPVDDLRARYGIDRHDRGPARSTRSRSGRDLTHPAG